MARKTRLMKRVEAEQGRSLEQLIPEMVSEKGLSATAEEFGVSKATVGYWMLKLSITIRRVAVMPGETIQVTKPDGKGPIRGIADERPAVGGLPGLEPAYQAPATLPSVEGAAAGPQVTARKDLLAHG